MLALVVDTSAHSRAAHPRAMCYKCYNESIFPHHKSVRMQPYLKSLPSYTDGAPPWAPTNKGHGITERQQLLERFSELETKEQKDMKPLSTTLVGTRSNCAKQEVWDGMQLTWNETGSNKCDGAPRLNPIREGDGYSKGSGLVTTLEVTFDLQP
ncbi:hypothetical protein DEO72_LG7g760 [Vigna unguiculata]|uniref:Uncharacterized protein n=1 Tax=Vigna unguiculata TaxID=3917 RepID=A0A4D6MGU0_VIGUN|nr:hypothetical protein DEO72_LG7g760 [Vigna unguiculata]